MSVVRSSLIYAAIGKYGEFFLFLAGTVVLSRLLTPKEIGVFVAANSIIAFAQTLRNFGTSDYLIQVEHNSSDKTRQALAVAGILSWLIAAVLAIFSGFIADYFEQPMLQKIILLVAISFVFLPISNIAHAQLSREMKFGTISLISILCSLINLSVAIILALNGYGAMSIAWATFAGNIAMVLLTILIAPTYTIFMPKFSDLRHVFSFGSWLTLSTIVRNLGFHGYMLIIAKILGFAALGLYMRAATVVERFSTILLDIIKAVALPSFARIKREKRAPGPDLLKALAIMAGFLWPFYGFIGLMAKPIVLLLFGWQWQAAIPIAQILALSVIASMNLTALMPTVLTAYGQVKLLFYFNLIIYSSRIIGVLIAVQYSLEAVAIAVLISSAVSVPLYVWALNKHFNVSVAETFLAHSRALLLTTLSLIPCLAIQYTAHLYQWPSIVILTVAGVASVGAWALFSSIISPLVYEELTKLFKIAFGNIRDIWVRVTHKK